MGYIFLALPSNLKDHAQRVADRRLLSAFMDQRMVEPRILRPTELGLFEYLQAVMEVNIFQEGAEERLQEIGKRDRNSACTLIRFPTLLGYVLREDQFWRFLGFLNNEREKLKLDSSLKVILCHPKMPFWSLMDQFTAYDGEDLYYDASEGSVVMFTKDEVSMIRSAASIAEREKVPTAQLNDLSRFARNHNLDELLLLVDIRAREDKIGRLFPDSLRKALMKLSYQGDTARDAVKRARFIDYIAKLARPPEEKKGRGGKKWGLRS